MIEWKLVSATPFYRITAVIVIRIVRNTSVCEYHNHLNLFQILKCISQLELLQLIGSGVRDQTAVAMKSARSGSTVDANPSECEKIKILQSFALSTITLEKLNGHCNVFAK